jgi:hypothetical protein
MTVRELAQFTEESTRVAAASDLQRLAEEARNSPKAPATSSKRETHRGGIAAPIWYALVNGEQIGPVDLADLQRRVRKGDVSTKTFVWRDGMGDWKRVSDVPELAAVVVPLTPKPERRAPGPLPKGSTLEIPAMPSPRAVEDPFAAADAPPFASPDDVSLAPDPSEERTTMATLAELANQSGAAKPRDRVTEPNKIPAGAISPIPFEVPVDLSSGEVGKVDEPKDAKPEETKKPVAPAVSAEKPDPFAAVIASSKDKGAARPQGEETRFFIAEAGIDKRNPPWKIALFVLAIVGLPLAAVYGLSQMKVVNIEVPVTVDEQGHQVKASVFSSEGVQALRNMLLRKTPPPAPEPGPTTGTSVRHAATTPHERPHGGPDAGISKEMLAAAADFYKSDERQDVGPKVDKTKITDKPVVNQGSGLDDKVVAEKVHQSQAAFQSCVEQEMHRNPNLRVPKMDLTVKVGVSGTVVSASLDRPEIAATSLGACLVGCAKRMVFPSSSDGAETEIHVPLHFQMVQ